MVALHPTNTLTIRKHNQSQVLQALCSCDRISQQEIAARLNLSVPTVLSVVKNLQNQGLVREVGAFASTGGRKAKAFSLVADSRHAIGVEITPIWVEFIAVNLAGKAVTRQRHDFPFVCDDAYFKKVIRLTNSFVANAPFAPGSIIGMGFSIPGIVSSDQTMVEFSHILGLENFPTERFCRGLPWPISFINDANAAGFAEFYNRVDTGNAIYLFLSTSVGGAIFIGGELYYGNNQRGGEFGHNTVIPDGKACYCGKKGCLDAYCSSKALAKTSGVGMDEFFPQLRAGDAKLQKIWDEYVYHLAIAVNNIRMTFDCDVVLGGHIGSRMGEYVEDVRKKLAKLNAYEKNAAYARTCLFKPGSSPAGAAMKHIEALLNGDTLQ
ncbi:MAG: ROK family transcriptional regulator [Planctomycetaceae bacterium]|nr:ROK family transcriptional regulator [Planctomycetaceae bacterium]